MIAFSVNKVKLLHKTAGESRDAIDYTFDVANSGNVTLSSVVVSDPLGGGLSISCGTTSSKLARWTRPRLACRPAPGGSSGDS